MEAVDYNGRELFEDDSVRSADPASNADVGAIGTVISIDGEIIVVRVDDPEAPNGKFFEVDSYAWAWEYAG